MLLLPRLSPCYAERQRRVFCVHDAGRRNEKILKRIIFTLNCFCYKSGAFSPNLHSCVICELPRHDSFNPSVPHSTHSLPVAVQVLTSWTIEQINSSINSRCTEYHEKLPFAFVKPTRDGIVGVLRHLSRSFNVSSLDAISEQSHGLKSAKFQKTEQ